MEPLVGHGAYAEQDTDDLVPVKHLSRRIGAHHQSLHYARLVTMGELDGTSEGPRQTSDSQPGNALSARDGACTNDPLAEQG